MLAGLGEVVAIGADVGLDVTGGLDGGRGGGGRGKGSCKQALDSYNVASNTRLDINPDKYMVT